MMFLRNTDVGLKLEISSSWMWGASLKEPRIVTLFDRNKAKIISTWSELPSCMGTMTPKISFQCSNYTWVLMNGTLKFSNSYDVVRKEIIHVPRTDHIYVCLVNTGFGSPFISALELRQLNNSIYTTQSGSLILFRRLDIGSKTSQTVRWGMLWVGH